MEAARGNPNIRDIARRPRKKRSDEEFYFHVDDRIRVTRDTYNLVLAEIYTAEGSGRKYQQSKGFYTTFGGIYLALEALQLNPQAIATFKERTKGITIDYENGKLKTEIPDEVTYDPHDILDEGEKVNTGEEK